MKIPHHVAVLLIAGATVAQGQTLTPLATQPKAVQLQALEYVIPELILGGEWTSSIKLTNRGTQAIPTTNVLFYDNTGSPMTATFQTILNGVPGATISDHGFSFSLGVGNILDISFSAGSVTSFGHGDVLCSAVSCGTPGLYGEVILKNHNSIRPDFESVFPFEKPAPLQYMLFDGRAGFSTVVYLCNENTTITNFTAEVRDTANNLLRTIPGTLSSLASGIYTLSDFAPETIGIEGTLVLRAPGALVTATALRINPTNSFTPVRAFIPAP